MNHELSLLVKDIPQNDLQLFIKNTKTNLLVKENINKVIVDYEWVDFLDESIPYLDSIIRNPRRFIVQEEDVVPIEKTKKVSLESIKHLATHTNLIQEVDDDGFVKPLKLLNVFKEETIDLYENRFIYSLITNLYTFVNNQLVYQNQSNNNKEEKSVNLESNTVFKDHIYTVKMNINCQTNDDIVVDEKLVEDREKKINHIKEILEDFMASKFMKAMANATPVRSPIRKTNVILKEQNFIKALELWEFLETYQTQKPVREINEENDLTNNTYLNEFNLTNFLNYEILNNFVLKSGNEVLPMSSDIPGTIKEYVKRYDINEIELKNVINNEIDKVTKYKNEQKTIASNIFSDFINNHRNRMKKASLLIK